jgi:hypothetical protein
VYIYCWIILLSNYNIKYICTIYKRLDTCLMSISRFSLRDKETLRLLQLYFCIVDVVEWSKALDIRLSDWCCSVSMVWVQIPFGLTLNDKIFVPPRDFISVYLIKMSNQYGDFTISKKVLTVKERDKRTRCCSYENTYIKELKSHI